MTWGGRGGGGVTDVKRRVFDFILIIFFPPNYFYEYGGGGCVSPCSTRLTERRSAFSVFLTYLWTTETFFFFLHLLLFLFRLYHSPLSFSFCSIFVRFCLSFFYLRSVGDRDSSVGIPTDYGLNGPEIKSW